MKHKTKSLSILLGLLLITATVVLTLSSGARTSLARLFSISPLAPPPSPTALRGVQSSPLGTPVPLPQRTAMPTLVATAIPTIPPPPGYPTGEPWPPQVTSETPQSTQLSYPFPTPVFRPTPRGRQPIQLQHLWFPYFPDPTSSPQLQAVLVDQQGQRWAQEARSIDLQVDPYPPGSVLRNLHSSPDHRWIIADLAFSGSYLIDLSSGASRPVISDVYAGPGQFLAWSPDSQHVVILPETFPQEVWLMDIFSQEHRVLELPTSDFGYSLVRTVAYSPDGKQLADAVVYPATISRPDEEIEIGVRVGEQGTRMSVFGVSGGGMIAEHGLRWSPDGRTLIFVADVHSGGRRTQLWAINIADGASRLLATLAREVQYNHPAVWSPDGRYVAAIVEEANENGIVSDNIFLFPLESGDARKITYFSNRRLSHLAWSPDGSLLAFSVSLGDYGEIWVTTLDGTHQYPIAGPTTPDAPFVWLP